jgi:hypothetical protein
MTERKRKREQLPAAVKYEMPPEMWDPVKSAECGALVQKVVRKFQEGFQLPKIMDDPAVVVLHFRLSEWGEAFTQALAELRLPLWQIRKQMAATLPMCVKCAHMLLPRIPADGAACTVRRCLAQWLSSVSQSSTGQAMIAAEVKGKIWAHEFIRPYVQEAVQLAYIEDEEKSIKGIVDIAFTTYSMQNALRYSA